MLSQKKAQNMVSAIFFTAQKLRSDMRECYERSSGIGDPDLIDLAMGRLCPDLFGEFNGGLHLMEVLLAYKNKIDQDGVIEPIDLCHVLWAAHTSVWIVTCIPAMWTGVKLPDPLWAMENLERAA